MSDEEIIRRARERAQDAIERFKTTKQLPDLIKEANERERLEHAQKQEGKE